MSSVYKRISWGEEPISTEKLDSMTANDDWLYENMVTAVYQNTGLVRSSGISMRAGYVQIANTPNVYQSANTYYSKPFLPGTKPVIVNGWTTDTYFGVLFAHKGLDNSAVPNHQGFQTICYDAMKKFGNSVNGSFGGQQFVGWVAIGPNN